MEDDFQTWLNNNQALVERVDENILKIAWLNGHTSGYREGSESTLNLVGEKYDISVKPSFKL